MKNTHDVYMNGAGPLHFIAYSRDTEVEEDKSTDIEDDMSVSFSLFLLALVAHKRKTSCLPNLENRGGKGGVFRKERGEETHTSCACI